MAQTRSKKQKAPVKRAQLEAMEEVLKEEHVAIGKLDQSTRDLLEDTKEAHAKADACFSTYVKLQEDLERCVSTVLLQELAVVKQELQEKEEEIVGKLTRERSELESHAADLSAHEAALAMELGHLWKTWEDLCNHELTISTQQGILEDRAIALTSKEKDLADKEKRLVKTELQGLATKCKTVEELQATQEVKAQKVWDFLGQTEMVLAPLGFSSIRSREPARAVSNKLPMLESA
jgi:hypothetical protein